MKKVSNPLPPSAIKPPPPPSPPAARLEPLSLLRTHQGEACALLLQSIESSHAGVLRFDDLVEVRDQGGMRTACGQFTHVPSGRRYVIGISAVSPITGEAS